jgi:hypothetical protein
MKKNEILWSLLSGNKTFLRLEKPVPPYLCRHDLPVR